MAARDPKVRALAEVERAADTVSKCEKQLEAARARQRAVLLAALRAGLTKADLARKLNTSETRVRHHINRALVEA